MAGIIIVGDGPGGLSAALFLAKNGHTVDVFGLDATAMHYAQLHNYLGAPDTSGSAFQAAARSQVTSVGARIHAEEVTSIALEGGLVEVSAGTDSQLSGDYLVLSEGKNPVLARALGLEQDEGGAIVVDGEGRSSNHRIYVVGRSARPSRSQAIISAGDGAKAAVDIMSREAGKDIQDWDTPPQD